MTHIEGTRLLRCASGLGLCLGRGRGVVIAVILAVLWAGPVETADTTPAWKIDRAEIERLSPATIQPRLRVPE